MHDEPNFILNNDTITNACFDLDFDDDDEDETMICDIAEEPEK